MRYDFDQPLDRRHTASIKWDGPRTQYGDADILPLGLADMDFVSPRPVTEAIIRRAEHGSFGYTRREDDYYAAVTGWMDRRYGWKVEPEWLLHGEGVVHSIGFLLHMLTKPGDQVILQTPAFGPLRQVILAQGALVAENPLIYANGRYTMDLVDFEAKLAGGAKLFLLCSPHNPVGRVWTREELSAVVELCARYGVPIISDEVHSGVIYSGHRHTPLAALSGQAADLAMVCTSASKAFNLAGLNYSVVIIPNPNLREMYKKALAKFDLDFGASLFGTVAATAAFRDGDEWLTQVTAYLEANLAFLADYLAQHIPAVKLVRPEGGYLAWLDCRGLGLGGKELEKFLLEQARVILVQGYTFGAAGDGFVRLNFACPRSVLTEGLERIERAVALR